MVATELSPEDMKLAMSLLAARKKEESAEEDFESQLKLKLTRIYEGLGIPKDDTIRFVKFNPKRTIVWGELTILSFQKNRIYSYETEVDDIDDGWDSLERLETRGRKREESLSRRCGASRGNSVEHTFFLNSLCKCPFCGYTGLLGNESVWAEKLHFYRGANYFDRLDMGCADSPVVSDFCDPFKFKRCYKHDKSSRVDYLKNEGRGVYYDRHSDAKRLLYDKIYPEPIKHSKNYYAEKRVKKVRARRSLTKSETSFFTMLLGASKLAQITPQKHEIPSKT